MNLDFSRSENEKLVLDNFSFGEHVVSPYESNVPSPLNIVGIINYGMYSPFVCQWWHINANGKHFLYKEIYMTCRPLDFHASDICTISRMFPKCRAEYYIVNRYSFQENAILSRSNLPIIPIAFEKEDAIKLLRDEIGNGNINISLESQMEIDMSLSHSNKPTSTTDEIQGLTYINNSYSGVHKGVTAAANAVMYIRKTRDNL